MSKPILHLNLKRKWFDMIKQGVKHEEYRSIKPYWSRVFHGTGIMIKGKNYHPTDVIICFSNGYSKDREQMYCDIKKLHVGYGLKHLGADPEEQYFVLSIQLTQIFNHEQTPKLQS